MKRFLYIFFVITALLAYLVFNLLNTTGYFRELVTKSPGRLLQTFNIKGAEDMEVLRDEGLLLVSADDRKGKKMGQPSDGGLYLINLKNEESIIKSISEHLPKPFHPHGLSVLKLDSAKYQVLVINHVEGIHSIESFILFGDSLVHQKTYKDELMISPNDVEIIGKDKFYFTNDHGTNAKIGRITEDYLGFGKGSVVFYDGRAFTTVATDLDYANGINYDKKRNLLFVALSKGFKIKVYQAGINGGLDFLEDIPLNTGPDNIDFDEKGNLWIGCHPNLIAFANYAKLNNEYSPSEVIRITYKGKYNYDIESVFVDDGKMIQASSVACRYNKKLVIGNVMADRFLIFEYPQ
ncbi:MAG: arylesterase/paraoxonase [Cyclobacteriaceae bacterium]|jgi:arylesterase/paraoxonase